MSWTVRDGPEHRLRDLESETGELARESNTVNYRERFESEGSIGSGG